MTRGTRGIVKIDIGHGLPVGEGWALEVAMRDLGERLRDLPAAYYLTALRHTFCRHARALTDEREMLTALAEALHSQLCFIAQDRPALSDEAEIVRLLGEHRKVAP